MSSTIVECAEGMLRGREHDGIHTFKGIPYAAPPLGELRFAAPRPPRPWRGLRDADTFAQPSAQVPPAIGDAIAGADPSTCIGVEDCLYLNVYTPTEPGPHPVLAWIHGGGAVCGSTDACDGTAFAQQGVVVVTMAYRLGALGLLHLPGVFDEQACCNFALLDQIAALGWIRRNIAAFGGDPRRVTLAGGSNGGRTVASLMASPPARGLFQQAAVLSGTGAGYLVADQQDAERLTVELLARLGLNFSRAGELRNLPVEHILAAQVAVLTCASTLLPFQVVLDDDTMPVRPIDAIANGAAQGVGLLVGSTQDEYDFFDIVGPGSGRSTVLSDEELESVVSAYRKLLPADWSEREVRRQAITAADWWIPAIRLAEATVQDGARAWMYRLDWRLAQRGVGYGAPHGLDAPLFSPHDPEHEKVILAAARRDVSSLNEVIEAMRAALVRFAHDGVPGASDWLPYDLQTRSTHLFDDVCAQVADPDRELRVALSEMLRWR